MRCVADKKDPAVKGMTPPGLVSLRWPEA